MRSPSEVQQAMEAARRCRPLTETEMTGLFHRGRQMAVAWGELRGPAA